MGRNGRARVREPEYGIAAVRGDLQYDICNFLTRKGIEVYTNEDCNVEDASYWELQLPQKKDMSPDYAKMQKVVDCLRKRPSAILDSGKRPAGNDVANMLQEGLDAARRDNAPEIVVEWA